MSGQYNVVRRQVTLVLLESHRNTKQNIPPPQKKVNTQPNLETKRKLRVRDETEWLTEMLDQTEADLMAGS